MSKDLIVRDEVAQVIFKNVARIVEEIFFTNCKWYEEGDESAQQLVDCIYKYIDYSNFTADEFEYLIKYVVYLCALKYLYICKVLKIDDEGEVKIPSYLAELVEKSKPKKYNFLVSSAESEYNEED